MKAELLDYQAKSYYHPDPKAAIQKLIDDEPIYMFNIKKLEQKKQLLNQAVLTNDGNIIIKVLLYLEYTLNQNIFKNLICSNVESLNYYLRYLKFEDKGKFKDICIELKEFKELFNFMLEEALRLSNSEEQLKKYKELLILCVDHEELTNEIPKIENYIEINKTANNFK